MAIARFLGSMVDKLTNWFIRLVLEVLVQDPQLAIVDLPTADQSRKNRSIEKLSSSELS
jgi:hypothetical protein